MARFVLLLLLALLALSANAIETVPIRENGMLRGPTEDKTVTDYHRRQLWGGWYTLLNHLCPPHHHSHGICKHASGTNGTNGGKSGGGSGNSGGGDTSSSGNGGGNGGDNYEGGNEENEVENYAGDGDGGSSSSGSATNRDAGTVTQASSSRSMNFLWAAGAVMASMIAGVVVWKRKQDEEEQLGLTHQLAGSVKRVMDGAASLSGSSTIATEENTAGPDFVSLDGSSSPHQEGIEMEAPRSMSASGRYAM